jgi:hypothetical protein
MLLLLSQTRNVAVGNNPCLPYDACVNTLAELAGVGPAAVGGASSAYNAGSSSANIGGVDLLSWEQVACPIACVGLYTDYFICSNSLM